MDFSGFMQFVDKSIYFLLAGVSIVGAFMVVLIFRRISQKRFSSKAAANAFLDQALELVEHQKFDELAELCDSPPYWSKATPQLILVALQNRHRGIGKLRQLLGEEFEREILADFDYRMSWVSAVVKTAPMLGLLGTVAGMINAFTKIASMQKGGVDPSKLADDIGFALVTTMIGLMIAVPLIIIGAAIQVRIGKLQSSVQQQLGEFLDVMDATLKKK
jgi:biopolymer transport protein ExbB/TolQ